VWISVPHADEITGACDLEVDLDDGIWHRAPLAVFALADRFAGWMFGRPYGGRP
jgi:hypothetical protein